jgi:hypothetical protein
VFAGIETEIVGVIVKLPIPVFAAALKSLTAVGADEPAGTPSGYVIELVGFVQVPVAHDELTPVALDAVVERRCGDPPPVVNVVDVTVTFQPEPDPVASRTVIGRV